jgi:hypothetical protein
MDERLIHGRMITTWLLRVPRDSVEQRRPAGWRARKESRA